MRGLTTYLYASFPLSVIIIGFWLFTRLKTNSSESIALMKSVIYLPFTAKVMASPSMIALILVLPAPLSVFPEEMMIPSFWVSIWTKLLISLVRIQIFLIAFSQRDLSTRIVLLKVVGIISSLS